VKTITPDAAAGEAMGLNLMDGSIAPVAAEHGLRQGEAIAEQLLKLWE
jgi:hypothetical protein